LFSPSITRKFGSTACALRHENACGVIEIDGPRQTRAERGTARNCDDQHASRGGELRRAIKGVKQIRL
jgi:hypothetical protein